MRTLHLAHDDKFLPFIQTVFEEVFPGRNEFRIPGNPARPLKFLRAGPGVEIRDGSYWTSDEVRRDASRADLVIVHFMQPLFVEALRRLPDHVAAMWVGWGGDFYDLIAPYLPQLVLAETSALAERARRRQRRRVLWRRLTRKIAYLMGVDPRGVPGRPVEPLAEGVRSVADRLDLVWFSPPELKLLRAVLPGLTAQNHRLCYYSAEHVFERGPSEWAGPDILAGNSATPTNNHAELFRLLARHDLEGRRVITPLSYGDPYYADEVERVGRRILGRRFVPIRRFMPLDLYLAHLASCGTVIMNHVRQQAGTTVATALYKGARVYMRGDSPMYRFYVGQGLNLYRTETDLVRAARPFEPTEPEDWEHNRRILRDYWGHLKGIEQVRTLEEKVAAIRWARAKRAVAERARTSPGHG